MSIPTLGTWAVLLAQGHGFRGAFCWNIGSTSLDSLLLQMECLAEQMDSQLSKRKGRYLMYHGGKGGGYSRHMKRQERRHTLCFLVHLEPSNLSLANLGKHKHGALWKGEGTVVDVGEVICTEAIKMKAESRKSLLSSACRYYYMLRMGKCSCMGSEVHPVKA